MTEQDRVVEVEAVVLETNAIAITDPIKAALVKDLGPIADRIALYEQKAQEIEVTNEDTAQAAAAVCDQIAEDVKAVKSHEVLSKITDGLHKLHRRWTGLRDQFITPMETARKQIKGKVITWTEAERWKAEQEQRRLQAEADAKARKEQEALLKKAESAKRPETQERYQEAAQAVQAPTVRIEAPKSGLRVSRVWVAKSIYEDEFFSALAHERSLRGFVKIDKTAMQRAKAANKMLDIPGVLFVQQVR